MEEEAMVEIKGTKGKGDPSPDSTMSESKTSRKALILVALVNCVVLAAIFLELIVYHTVVVGWDSAFVKADCMKGGAVNIKLVINVRKEHVNFTKKYVNDRLLKAAAFGTDTKFKNKPTFTIELQDDSRKSTPGAQQGASLAATSNDVLKQWANSGFINKYQYQSIAERLNRVDLPASKKSDSVRNVLLVLTSGDCKTSDDKMCDGSSPTGLTSKIRSWNANSDNKAIVVSIGKVAKSSYSAIGFDENNIYVVSKPANLPSFNGINYLCF